MELEVLCQKTSGCKASIGKLTTAEKNQVLCTAADLLMQNTDAILRANEQDIANAIEKVLAMSAEERAKMGKIAREKILKISSEENSLKLLINRTF